MTCDEAEVLLHALIDGELDAGHAREVENHIAGCSRCAAALRDYREMSKAIAEAGARYTAPALQGRMIRAQRPGSRLRSPAGPTDDGPETLLEAGALYAGQTVARIADVRPAADLVRVLTP